MRGMVVFLLVLVVGGAAVIWQELPVWMYGVLIVVAGWRVTIHRHARALSSDRDAAPLRSTADDDERP